MSDNENYVLVPVKADDTDPEHGTRESIRRTNGAVTLSGASTALPAADASNLIHAGDYVKAGTGRVTTGVTGTGGATLLQIGTANDPTAFASLSLPVAADTKIEATDNNIGNGVRFDANTAVTATTNAGTFSAGAVKFSVHIQEFIAPTS